MQNVRGKRCGLEESAGVVIHDFWPIFRTRCAFFVPDESFIRFIFGIISVYWDASKHQTVYAMHTGMRIEGRISYVELYLYILNLIMKRWCIMLVSEKKTIHIHLAFCSSCFSFLASKQYIYIYRDRLCFTDI